MKRFLTFLCLVVVCFSVSSLAGQEEKIDTIYLKDGKTISAKVTAVTAAYVNFVNIEKSTRDQIARKDVHKIIYHNGVAQELDPPAFQTENGVSWKDVRLTEKRKDVARLHKRGAIEAVAAIHANGKKAARQGAETQLKKKAAALQCHVVLVTGREQKRTGRNVSRYIIKGMAYGKEPLK